MNNKLLRLKNLNSLQYSAKHVNLINISESIASALLGGTTDEVQCPNQGCSNDACEWGVNDACNNNTCNIATMGTYNTGCSNTGCGG